MSNFKKIVFLIFLLFVLYSIVFFRMPENTIPYKSVMDDCISRNICCVSTEPSVPLFSMAIYKPSNISRIMAYSTNINLVVAIYTNGNCYVAKDRNEGGYPYKFAYLPTNKLDNIEQMIKSSINRLRDAKVFRSRLLLNCKRLDFDLLVDHR